jgi:flagellar biosynthesis/type III secretory pathway protein FliH
MVHFCGGNLSDDDRILFAEKAREAAYAEGYRDGEKESIEHLDALLNINEVLRRKVESLEAEVDSLYQQIHGGAWERKYAGGGNE